MIRLVGLIFLISSVLSLDCQKKNFPGSNSFVCVCNTESCDNLPSKPLDLQSDDIVTFTSDLAEHRLHETRLRKENLFGEVFDADIQVTVNLTDRKQTIIGFGGAFTDAFGINLNKLSEPLQERLLRDLFDKDGLEYNFGRVPIGGADFSDRPYSYDDGHIDDFELEHFSLVNDDYKYKIPHIKTAQKFSKSLKLFGSPWAPPAWLKTNGKPEGLGILIGEPGSKQWKTYANYLIKFFDAYKEHGVEFWGFTPQNEPLTGLTPFYSFNTLGFSSWMMKEFIKKDLGPALNSSGYSDLKLMIYDHNKFYLETFVTTILKDKEAAKYVSGIAYHWYDYHGFEQLSNLHDAFPEYFILSTEACEGAVRSQSDAGVTLANWTRAETYASDIIEGLNHWSTGWVDWNFALDEQGGPNWVSNFVDAPIIIPRNEDNIYYKQPMFYSLAHFSKFLPRGSVRVHHEVLNELNDSIKLVSFIRPDNNVVFVVLNTGNSSVKLSLTGVSEKPLVLTLTPRSLQTILTPFVQSSS